MDQLSYPIRGEFVELFFERFQLSTETATDKEEDEKVSSSLE